MSDIQLIETAVKKAGRRRRWERVWRGFWFGLLAGGSVWLLATGLYRLFPIPAWIPMAGAAAGAILVLGALVWGAWHRVPLLETARWVDRRKDLKERLSTALELEQTSQNEEWKKLVVSDAARHARELDPRHLLPLRLTLAGRWALIIVCFAVGLGFVPPYRSKAFTQKEQTVANIRETGKQLAGFTRQNLQQRPPALVPTQKALEKVAEAGEKLSKASLTRSEALRDLASVTDKIAEQAKELGKTPGLKPLERAARESDGSPAAQNPEAAKAQAEALKEKLGKAADQPRALDKAKSSLEKAQQAVANLANNDSPAAKAARQQLAESLSQLSQEMKDMGVSLPDLDQAIKALERNDPGMVVRDLDKALNDLDKLREMAKALQQMQQQMARTGKDLGEQLDRGQAQAAQRTLQKMIDQLRSGDLTKEQLEKLQQEITKAIDPGSKYGKVGEHLNKASQQCQGGDKSGAAQSLAQAAQELEKLQQQLADLNALMDGLDALDRAQMAIASGKEWSQCQGNTCSACNGKGCGKCRGKGWCEGGRGGSGVGTWADETGWVSVPEQMPVDNSGITRPDMDSRGLSDRDTVVNPNLAPTKVRGQMSQGGPLPSITLKGVSIKGKSTLEYEQAATAAQSDAQSALNQDKVPRAYQEAVRSYFDDIKK